jgi:hypothetical protein
MGGHEGGAKRRTSRWTIFVTSRRRRHAPDIPPAVRAREVLRDAIALANARVFAMAAPRGRAPRLDHRRRARPRRSGRRSPTSATAAATSFTQGQIRQVTRDHSMVQQMVDAGILTPEQAAVHPDANKITRALGIGRDVDVELQRQSIAHEAGDAFILCSDGLSDLVHAERHPAHRRAPPRRRRP